MSVKDIVKAARERIQRDEDAELQRVIALLRLPEHAAKAKRHADAIAGRASEIATLLKDHTVDAADEVEILARRPRLDGHFTRLHAALDDVRGQTVDVQGRLKLALGRYDNLSPDDLRPLPNEWLAQTPFGPLSNQIWKLYADLANLRPLVDIDAAIERLKVAHAELLERLKAVAA